MAETSILTEADILSEVVAPDRPSLSPESARSILELRFTERATSRMRELLDKNNKGTISTDERSELDKYLRVGQFLDLMQAKARLSIQQSGLSA
jgi:hypothetical protein